MPIWARPIPTACSASRAAPRSRKCGGAIARSSSENHPDRLIARGVPEEFVAIANGRLAAINQAYRSLERALKPA